MLPQTSCNWILRTTQAYCRENKDILNLCYFPEQIHFRSKGATSMTLLTQNNPQQRGVLPFCPTLCQNSILGFLILGNFFYPEKVSLAPLHLVNYSISAFSHVFCFSEKIYELVDSWIKPYTLTSVSEFQKSIPPYISNVLSSTHPATHSPTIYYTFYLFFLY